MTSSHAGSAATRIIVGGVTASVALGCVGLVAARAATEEAAKNAGQLQDQIDASVQAEADQAQWSALKVAAETQRAQELEAIRAEYQAQLDQMAARYQAQLDLYGIPAPPVASQEVSTGWSGGSTGGSGAAASAEWSNSGSGSTWSSGSTSGSSSGTTWSEPAPSYQAPAQVSVAPAPAPVQVAPAPAPAPGSVTSGS